MKKPYLLASKVRIAVFDFDGVFTDNRVYVFQDGTEAVSCYRSDGIGLSKLRKSGVELLVLSSEVNPVVKMRCEKLHIKCINACDDKLNTLRNELSKTDIQPDEVAYLGNDINDLECMEYVGLPACVADAYPEVKRKCRYITQKKGGCGAVREFCDLIVRSKSK